MLKRLEGFYSDEGGQILPMFGMLLVILLGLSAIAIDSGGIFHTRNENYNIAEASALSTISYLEAGSDKLVKSTAKEYALFNGAKDGDVSVITRYDVVGDNGEAVNEVTVIINKEYDLIFGGLLKYNNDRVREQYTAQVPK